MAYNGDPNVDAERSFGGYCIFPSHAQAAAEIARLRAALDAAVQERAEVRVAFLEDTARLVAERNRARERAARLEAALEWARNKMADVAEWELFDRRFPALATPDGGDPIPRGVPLPGRGLGVDE